MAVNLNEMLGARVAPDMVVAPVAVEQQATQAAQDAVQDTFEPKKVVYEVPASPSVVDGVTASIA